jgi:hypothetical protein
MDRTPLNVHSVCKALFGIGLLLSSLSSITDAQQPPHYEHAGNLIPGQVGWRQTQRGGPIAGYFQPVEIKMPAGSGVSLAIENQFSVALENNFKVGLLVAPVYRLKVINIPRLAGIEVYPTIEIVNRTYPPRGQEFDFPIPIELTEEDLALAAQGKFVTRIVYVENPQAALPQAIKEQPWFEIAPGQDPLAVADRLGRPIAIIRMGGRLPDPTVGPDARFMYGSPAMLMPQSLLQAVYPQGTPQNAVPVPVAPPEPIQAAAAQETVLLSAEAPVLNKPK